MKLSLNICMNQDIYFSTFSRLLDDISSDINSELNPVIHIYLSSLLAEYIEKTDFFATPLGLRYLKALNENNHKAKEIGDSCLILTGFFPEFKGLQTTYFIAIGSGSYDIAAEKTGSEVFRTLSDNFVDLMRILRHIRQPYLD